MFTGSPLSRKHKLFTTTAGQPAAAANFRFQTETKRAVGYRTAVAVEAFEKKQETKERKKCIVPQSF
jgi:hypothetical protein